MTRTARSRPVLVAGAVLVATLVAWVSGAWQGDVATVGKVLTPVLTALAALATLGLALGRVLFWASPAFGRLHQRADDNPLGEIAATVAALRRWSPRGIRGHRVADTLAGLVVGGAVIGYLLALLRDPAMRSGAVTELRWIGGHSLGLGVAVIATLLVVGYWHRVSEWLPAAASTSPAPQPAPRPQPVGFGGRTVASLLRMAPLQVTLPWQARRWLARLRLALLGLALLRVLLLAVAVAGVYLAFSPELVIRRLPALPMIQRHPGGWALGAVLGCAALYALWAATRRRQPRRPILL